MYLLLAKAFSRAIREGLIDVSPLKRSAIKSPAKVRQSEAILLTVEDVERLADEASHPRDRLAILLMAYAGLRGRRGRAPRSDTGLLAPRGRLV